MSYLMMKITDRATDSFRGVNFDEWKRHWFETAEAFAKEMQDEGLIDTAIAVDGIIHEQRRFSR